MNNKKYKYTPGPWKAIGFTNVQTKLGGQKVAKILTEDKEEARANTCLISQAPSLRTFLQEALEVVLYYYPTWLKEADESELKTMEEMTHRWKDVLDKARGTRPMKPKDFGHVVRKKLGDEYDV